MARHALALLALLALPAAAQEATAPAAAPEDDPCVEPGEAEPDEEGSLFSRSALGRDEAYARRRAAACREALPFAGRPLYETVVECDVDVCVDPARRAVLVRLAGLSEGEPLDPREVGDAWFRLQRTGFFRALTVEVERASRPPAAGPMTADEAEAMREAEDARDADPRPPPAPDAVRVRFVATGHVVITDLDVEYVGWASRLYPQLFRTEIRKRLPLRRGGSFPARGADGRVSPEDALRIVEWQRRVVSLYEQMGFVGTKVEIEPTWHGPGDTLVRVVVRVDEGRQPEIGEVLVKGNKAFPYWRIVEPLTTGERIDTLRDIFAIFGIGRYARRELKDELEAVEQRYREAGWVTARVRLESPFAEKGGRVYPRVRVYEGPRLEVRFVGNQSLDAGELADVLTFAENGAIDDTEVEASRNAIVAAYQGIARFDVRVEAELERPSSELSRVTFTIDEGGRIYVGRVEIVGNRQLSDERIFEVMETRGIAPDGVINAFSTSAGVLQDARIINDLIAVRELYHDHGMPGLRFRCGDPRRVTAGERDAIRAAEATPMDDGMMGPSMGPAATRIFDVWTHDPVNHICYQVLPDPDPRLVVLRIELEEGRRATVDSLLLGPLLEGSTDEARDEAYDLLGELGFVDDTLDWQTAGLNRRKLDAVRGFLLRQWHQQGFIDAQVVPRCPPPPELPSAREARRAARRAARAEGRDPDDAERDFCTEENLYGLELDRVDFGTELGPRTFVDGILLQGNLRTARSIIEAELLFEDGQPLGTDQLFRSQANLRSLGIFDAVQMETISDARRPGDRADRREAAVMITVEEGDYRFADLFVGLQIDSTPIEDELPILYSVGGSIRDRNLFGWALEVGAGVNFINRLDDPIAIGEYDETVFEAGPFLKDRRLFGTRLDFTFETTYKTGRTAQRDAYEQVIGFRPTIGYDFQNLSYPADWGRGLRATLVTDYRIEQRRALKRSTGEVPLFGDPTQSVTLEPNITWDRRDSPLHPTRGGVVFASAEIVFNAFNQLESLVLEPSFKEALTAQYVQSFFERQLIVAPTLRIGAVQTDQPEAELKSGFFFKAGGDGVALPVRGYADAVIEACRGRDAADGPCAEVYPEGVDPDDPDVEPQRVGGKAMLLGSLEARFPTFLLDDFWWSVFSDVGAVAPSWSDMALDRFYPSVGVGLRWLVTGQVPLRLDLAYPLREDPFAAQTLRVHLNIFYPL